MVAGDFRKGVTIEIDGKVYMVVDFQHVKPGKGAAFVRTKLKNVVTGQVLEQTFNPTDKYPDARIERKEMQYRTTPTAFTTLWIWKRSTCCRSTTTSLRTLCSL